MSSTRWSSALSLVPLSLVCALAALTATGCSESATSTRCTARTTSDPEIRAAKCTSTASATSIAVTGESCTLATATRCSFAVTGSTLTFTMTGQVCMSSEAQSTGCVEARATCDGPKLAPGTYALTGTTTQKLVVTATGGCTLEP